MKDFFNKLEDYCRKAKLSKGSGYRLPIELALLISFFASLWIVAKSGTRLSLNDSMYWFFYFVSFSIIIVTIRTNIILELFLSQLEHLVEFLRRLRK